MKSPKNNKGFTLLEIMLVIAVMAIIATAAIQSSVRTQKQFSYLAELKAVVAELREARTHAVTHLAVPDLTDYNDNEETTDEKYIPPSYGVHIKENKIITFADLAGNDSPGIYDSTDCSSDSNCDYEISSYEDTNDPLDKYEIKVKFPLGIDLQASDTITLFYQPTYAEFFAITTPPAPIPNYIVLKFIDTNNGFGRYIVIFTKSGLIEIFTLDELCKIISTYTECPPPAP